MFQLTKANVVGERSTDFLSLLPLKCITQCLLSIKCIEHSLENRQLHLTLMTSYLQVFLSYLDVLSCYLFLENLGVMYQNQGFTYGLSSTESKRLDVGQATLANC